LKVRIIYDNEAGSGVRSGWGFSCLIGEELLFDTGANMNILSFNMRRFGIDIKRIKGVFFSHEHGDHTGGYKIIEKMGDVDVYILRSFSKHFKGALSSMPNVNLIEIKEPRTLYNNFYTTGELGFFVREHSLIVETGRGATVITGCSHPGLDKIINVASKFGDVYSVIGGFHGFNRLEALKDLELIVPCHCTTRKREILNLYPSKSLRCYTGLQLEV